MDAKAKSASTTTHALIESDDEREEMKAELVVGLISLRRAFDEMPTANDLQLLNSALDNLVRVIDFKVTSKRDGIVVYQQVYVLHYRNVAPKPTSPFDMKWEQRTEAKAFEIRVITGDDIGGSSP